MSFLYPVASLFNPSPSLPPHVITPYPNLILVAGRAKSSWKKWQGTALLSKLKFKVGFCFVD